VFKTKIKTNCNIPMSVEKIYFNKNRHTALSSNNGAAINK